MIRTIAILSGGFVGFATAIAIASDPTVRTGEHYAMPDDSSSWQAPARQPPIGERAWSSDEPAMPLPFDLRRKTKRSTETEGRPPQRKVRVAKRTADPDLEMLLPEPSESFALTMDGDPGIAELQNELVRLGCFDGSVDGQWSIAFHAGLARFALAAELEFEKLSSTDTVLNLMLRQSDRVCRPAAKDLATGQIAVSTKPQIPDSIEPKSITRRSRREAVARALGGDQAPAPQAKANDRRDVAHLNDQIDSEGLSVSLAGPGNRPPLKNATRQTTVRVVPMAHDGASVRVTAARDFVPKPRRATRTNADPELTQGTDRPQTPTENTGSVDRVQVAALTRESRPSGPDLPVLNPLPASKRSAFDRAKKRKRDAARARRARRERLARRESRRRRLKIARRRRPRPAPKVAQTTYQPPAFDRKKVFARN